MESKLLCGFLFSLHVRGLLLVFCLVSKGVNVLTSPVVGLLGSLRRAGIAMIIVKTIFCSRS